MSAKKPKYIADSAEIAFNGETMRQQVILIAGAEDVWKRLVADGRLRASACHTVKLDERDVVMGPNPKDIVMGFDEGMARDALRGGRLTCTMRPGPSAAVMRAWANAVGIDVDAPRKASRKSTPEDEARIAQAVAKRERKAAARRRA